MEMYSQLHFLSSHLSAMILLGCIASSDVHTHVLAIISHGQFLTLSSYCSGTRAPSPASNPSNPPEMWTLAPSSLGPTHAPSAPKHHGS